MRFLYLFNQAPYQGGQAKEALDMALACAAFDQDVTLVFCGRGIYQLIGNQAATAMHKKSLIGAINALPLYDVTQVYYLSEDLPDIGLSPEQLVNHAKALPARELPRLLSTSDIIQSF